MKAASKTKYTCPECGTIASCWEGRQEQKASVEEMMKDVID
jgi:predicted RNA-binding Zn-ribbon protein involved in translation (DUF1610 family)